MGYQSIESLYIMLQAQYCITKRITNAVIRGGRWKIQYKNDSNYYDLSGELK